VGAWSGGARGLDEWMGGLLDEWMGLAGTLALPELDRSRAVSPLTPALSPLRGEGEEAVAWAGSRGEDEDESTSPLTPALSSDGGEGEEVASRQKV